MKQNVKDNWKGILAVVALAGMVTWAYKNRERIKQVITDLVNEAKGWDKDYSA